MKAQEIKDLIASKIAGQGSAVDAGSALPEILNGIVDAIGEMMPSAPLKVLIEVDTPITVTTKQEFANLLEISENDVDAIFEGKVPAISFLWWKYVALSAIGQDRQEEQAVYSFWSADDTYNIVTFHRDSQQYEMRFYTV